jgi:hypothetical protein
MPFCLEFDWDCCREQKEIWAAVWQPYSSSGILFFLRDFDALLDLHFSHMFFGTWFGLEPQIFSRHASGIENKSFLVCLDFELEG